MPLPFLLRRSWESRGLFRQSRWRHLLYGSPPRKPHGSLSGHWRFCATQPEAGKPRGLFRQSPLEALIYGSLLRKPHSPLPGRSGGTGAFTPSSRKQES